MKKIAIALLLSTYAMAPAFAADTPFYAGINVGTGKIDLSGTSSTTSFELLGGYTINQYFAAEAAYSDFGNHDYPGGNMKSSAVSIKGVGAYPINEQFSVFAKLGIASTTWEVSPTGLGTASESKTDLTYGIGGQFNINQQIGIRLGYDVYKLGSSLSADEKVTSIGAVFKF